MIRNSIASEMLEVVKGWGVYIETIEITDVKILSNALFKDLQSKFREEQKQKAEMDRMTTNQMIESQRLLSQLEMSKLKNDSQAEQNLYRAKRELDLQEEHAHIFELKVKQDQIR